MKILAQDVRRTATRQPGSDRSTGHSRKVDPTVDALILVSFKHPYCTATLTPDREARKLFLVPWAHDVHTRLLNGEQAPSLEAQPSSILL